MQVWRYQYRLRLCHFTILQDKHEPAIPGRVQWCTCPNGHVILKFKHVIVAVEYLIFCVDGVFIGGYQVHSDFDDIVVEVDVAVGQLEKPTFESTDEFWVGENYLEDFLFFFADEENNAVSDFVAF